MCCFSSKWQTNIKGAAVHWWLRGQWDSSLEGSKLDRSLFSPPSSAWSFLLVLFLFICACALALLFIDASVKPHRQGSCAIPGGVAATPEPLLWSLVSSGPNPKTWSSRLIKIKRTRGHSARARRHRKIKPSWYYGFVITNSGALSYAGATVESASRRSTAFQSPPMGSVIQRAQFVPMASERLMDEHQERLPHVSLFHAYFNLNADFCSLCWISNGSEWEGCFLFEV